jgi:hypothetical protein
MVRARYREEQIKVFREKERKISSGSLTGNSDWKLLVL